MQVDYTNLNTYLQNAEKAMKPLQRKVIIHAKRNKRTIIESPMGTGKTLMLLTATLINRPEKVLIGCSKNALGTWKKELLKWYPDYGTDAHYNIIRGSAAERANLWSKDTLFYVCTYNVLREDWPTIVEGGFDAAIFDEFHRAGLRQHTLYKKRGKDPLTHKPIKSLTGYGIVKKLQDIPIIYPTTGTLVYKGPQDVWPTLNILAPKKFPSYWKFTQEHCEIDEGFWGNKIVGVKDSMKFAKACADYWYSVPKEEADKELPPMSKQLIPIEMNPKQKQMYESYAKNMFLEKTDGDLSVASTSLALYTRLRQILACPKIIDPKCGDYGASIENIVDMAKDANNDHIVVFTPYRDAIPYLKEYIAQHLNEDVFHVWGNIEPEELHGTIAQWKKAKGVMVCTTLFSQSFELETSNMCFFNGYEWDQNDNDQAAARLRRLISPGPIKSYYMQHTGTIDDHILEILMAKRQASKVTTQDFEKLREIMRARYGTQIK